MTTTLEKYRNQIRHSLRNDFVKHNPTASHLDITEYMENAEVRWVSRLTRIPSTESLPHEGSEQILPQHRTRTQNRTIQAQQAQQVTL